MAKNLIDQTEEDEAFRILHENPEMYDSVCIEILEGFDWIIESQLEEYLQTLTEEIPIEIINHKINGEANLVFFAATTEWQNKEFQDSQSQNNEIRLKIVKKLIELGGEINKFTDEDSITFLNNAIYRFKDIDLIEKILISNSFSESLLSYLSECSLDKDSDPILKKIHEKLVASEVEKCIPEMPSVLIEIISGYPMEETSIEASGATPQDIS